MATSLIGPFSFVTLHNPHSPGGAPVIPTQMTEIDARPGVDGISVILLGEKGVPFQMVGGVDVDDRYSAESLIENYAQFGGEITSMTWRGINFSAIHSMKFIVLAVTDYSIAQCAAAAGGFSTNKAFWVSSVWNLVGIRV